MVFSPRSLGPELRRRLAGLRQWVALPNTHGLRLLILLAEFFLVAASLLINVTLYIPRLGEVWALAAASVFLPLVLALRGGALLAFGVFQRSFRYASSVDVAAIASAVGLSGLAWFIIYRAWDFGVVLPGELFVSEGLTLFALLTTVHFSARIYNHVRVMNGAEVRPAIIVGAGDAGASVLRELLVDPRAGLRPLALVDDDPNKLGMRISGVPVVGTLADLPDVAFKYGAVELLVCIPSATPAQITRLLGICRKCGVPARTLPRLAELVNGRATLRDLRSIRIEDLLQRNPIVPDASLTRRLVEGKSVLVTGAGGSIGSELCQQLAAAGPRRLILLDKSETNLFYNHLSIEENFPDLETVPVLADIVDQHLVREMFEREQPDLVFHAAAFKHVGMMERHPCQAIQNNVLGTRNVLAASLENGVQRFVNISTDKAVNPRSYMGLSKKLTELMVKEAAELHGARVMSVRFGNVAGSSGSVLRIFSDQITKRAPLRVTDPQATRYFMSVSEAVYLILCAASLGRGGETFILDMGRPVNIYELARTLSLFAGVAPEEELPIHFTGLREGEKVHEELREEWEVPRPTEHPQIFELAGANPHPIDILPAVERMEQLLAVHDRAGLLGYIDRLAPNFARGRNARPAWPDFPSWQEDFAKVH